VVDPSAAALSAADAARNAGNAAVAASATPGAFALPAASAGVSAASLPPAAGVPAGSVLGLPSAVQPTETGSTVSVTEPVWLEVIDGGGNVVFLRTIQPGEVLNFDQKLPLRMKVGNAGGAKITFRGETVDLLPLTRANVARVVLN
jgi:cytoskeleton protein RodZ